MRTVYPAPCKTSTIASAAVGSRYSLKESAQRMTFFTGAGDPGSKVQIIIGGEPAGEKAHGKPAFSKKPEGFRQKMKKKYKREG